MDLSRWRREVGIATSLHGASGWSAGADGEVVEALVAALFHEAASGATTEGHRQTESELESEREVELWEKSGWRSVAERSDVVLVAEGECERGDDRCVCDVWTRP